MRGAEGVVGREMRSRGCEKRHTYIKIYVQDVFAFFTTISYQGKNVPCRQQFVVVDLRACDGTRN